MSTATRLPGHSPLGPTSGQARVNRGEQRGAQQDADRGIGLRHTEQVTIEAGESAVIRHGLRARPEHVSVTAVGEPCAYAVTAETAESVTVKNNEAAARTLKIGVFG